MAPIDGQKRLQSESLRQTHHVMQDGPRDAYAPAGTVARTHWTIQPVE